MQHKCSCTFKPASMTAGRAACIPYIRQQHSFAESQFVQYTRCRQQSVEWGHSLHTQDQQAAFRIHLGTDQECAHCSLRPVYHCHLSVADSGHVLARLTQLESLLTRLLPQLPHKRCLVHQGRFQELLSSIQQRGAAFQRQLLILWG